MNDFEFVKNPETLSIIHTCAVDDTVMNYQIATDQWQCPLCLGVIVKDGGKPQTETDHGKTDGLQPGDSGNTV